MGAACSKAQQGQQRCPECGLCAPQAAFAAPGDACLVRCRRYGANQNQTINELHDVFDYVRYRGQRGADAAQNEPGHASVPLRMPDDKAPRQCEPYYLLLRPSGEEDVPPASLVGGKAYGLLRAHASSRITDVADMLPGFVLPTRRQDMSIDHALAAAGLTGAAVKLAVRSSCTVEDTAASSMAGVFATVTDVPRERVQAAIATVDASKHGHAGDMAVIVMQMLDAEVSGIAFSLEPVSNRQDRFSIAAAPGAGERVVQGSVSPDEWVLARRDGAVVSGPSAGCLSPARLAALHKLLLAVEQAWLGVAVDTEFAFAPGSSRPTLLQVRPVTAYVPVPAAMLALPYPMLYEDGLLSEQGLSHPMSVFGCSMFDEYVRASLIAEPLRELASAFSSSDDPRAVTYVSFDTGRMYANVSSLTKLSGRRAAYSALSLTDVDSAEAVRRMRLDPFLKGKSPLSIPALLRAAWRSRSLALRVYRLRQLYHADAPALYVQYLDAWTAMLNAYDDMDVQRARVAPRHMLAQLTRPWLEPNLLSLMLLSARGEAEKIRRMCQGNAGITDEMIDAALGTPPRNLTIELQFRVQDAAEHARPDAWERLLSFAALRSVVEVDIATRRFGDDEAQLRQMIESMNALPVAARPRQVAERTRARALAARDEIAAKLGDTSARAERFRRAWWLHDLLSGQRESPKLLMVLQHSHFRWYVTELAVRWKSEGRLDRVIDVFDLSLDDVEAAYHDAKLDLRVLREERLAFRCLHRNNLTAVPLIASTGEIIDPIAHAGNKRGDAAAAAAAPPDALLGRPGARGTATGRARVIRDASELVSDPVAPGDVMIVQGAHPGYMPGLISASALVMAIGGSLQHAVLLAKELGRPVVLLPRAHERIQTGQFVQVNGTQGWVRVLPDLHADAQNEQSWLLE